VGANFRESPKGEVRRICLLGTPVNSGLVHNQATFSGMDRCS
jgi:hypothetical protein